MIWTALAAGGRGEVFVAGGGTIWKLSGSRLVPVAGEGVPGTVPVAGRTDLWPWAMVGDGEGGVYFAVGNQVRRVGRAGQASIIAGSDEAGFSGDGGPAVDALLSRPCDLALDGDRCLLIKDADNARVRKVDQRGTLSTVNWYGGSPRSKPQPTGRWTEIGQDERGMRYRFRRSPSVFPRRDGPAEMRVDGLATAIHTGVVQDAQGRLCFLDEAMSDPPRMISLSVTGPPGTTLRSPAMLTVGYRFTRIRRAERDGRIHTLLTGGGRLADSRGVPVGP